MSCNHLDYCQRCENYTESLECRIADLESRLAAAEADAERLLIAARAFSEETKQARKHYASVMTFSMVCAMDQLEKVVAEIDAARGGE